MTADQKMPDDAVIERIQKILALGRRGGTEAEASSAMAKAQQMLADYNLDIATVERGGRAGDARREQAAALGGMYHYQRELWRAVAELNFCAYFTSGSFVRRRVAGVVRSAWVAKHAFVGRVVNTRATLHMGEYLEGEIERLCREALEPRVVVAGAVSAQKQIQSAYYSSWACGFREGAADRVVEKLAERRKQQIRADELRARRAAKMAGQSTSRALTLGTLAQQEEAANYDFQWGEGSWAEKLADEAAASERRRRRDEEWTRFKKENPEEARAMEEKARKERRRRWSGGGSARRMVNSGGYSHGSEAGEGIGIDPQASGAGTRRLR